MTVPADQTIEPDADAIASFATTVFGYVEGIVPLRILPEKGMPASAVKSIFASADDDLPVALLGAARQANRARMGLFVVPGTMRRRGRVSADAIDQFATVLADLDVGDIDAKVRHLTKALGQPTLEVASGGLTNAGEPKRHLYWRLSEAASGEDLVEVCGLRKLLAQKVGGDISFASAHQLIRVPGSVHCKHGNAAPVRVLSQTGRDYELSDLAAAIEAMPHLDKHDVGQRHTIAIGPVRARDLMTRVVRENGADGITRYDALSKMIGHWLRQARLGCASEDGAWKAVREYNASAIQPSWSEDRLRREFDALRRQDALNHGQRAQILNAEDRACEDLTGEDALADAFSSAHATDWKFVQAWGQWLEWRGSHWQLDVIGRVVDHARKVCRTAATNETRPAEAKRIASDRTIRAVERLARSDPRHARRADDWDAEGMLLNTTAGIVDLETGEIGPHDREACMTRVTQASPGGAAPQWHRFLDRITDGDVDLAGYLARMAGYCLTGSNAEQVFFFLHGGGSNGKSVFLASLLDALGTYATTAAQDTFMASRSDRHPTDLAGLVGARLVTVGETEAGRAWAESRIKTITGGDPLRARFMHRDFFEFVPQFKLLIAGNHRPRLSGVGQAMRRRLHLVPFAVTISPEERDKDLGAKLRAERDGILGWMLQGCADWQRTGLSPPPSILDAAATYFDDEDLVGQWIAEVCECAGHHQSSSHALFSSWTDWAKSAGVDPGSQRDLAEQLRSRGYRPHRSARLRGWIGIAPRRAQANCPVTDGAA